MATGSLMMTSTRIAPPSCAFLRALAARKAGELVIADYQRATCNCFRSSRINGHRQQSKGFADRVKREKARHYLRKTKILTICRLLHELHDSLYVKISPANEFWNKWLKHSLLMLRFV